MEEITTSLVDWSRGQFALTAMYHWLFVPLTLGLSVIMAIFETIYYRTGAGVWKQITKFWMMLFGINFAIGIATGIILEFQFGTNWSNYSWFVGDIFGAPLAIEGIMAFFLESIFSAVMFFGWNKVSKGVHLLSTWLTAVGASLSALWILVANAWMQYPVGMRFNAQTVRNEMISFWDLVSSPVAINKFFHTVISSWVLAAVFVVGVSCWFLIKRRNLELAAKSIKVASIVGLVGIAVTIFTGDDTAKVVARVQPMKLAAMEGLYKGSTHQSIVAFGILNPEKKYYNNEEEFLFVIRIPDVLSWLAYKNTDAFVPGINDIIEGDYLAYGLDSNYVMPPMQTRIENGRKALTALSYYRDAVKEGNASQSDIQKTVLEQNYPDFGYGYVERVRQVIPPVTIVFYAFHIMVTLGFYFVFFFILFLVLFAKQSRVEYDKNRFWMKVGLWSMPLAYIMSEAGWVTSEVGRQPWTIQDILPTFASISRLPSGSVQTTFWLFFVLFTLLLIADVWILSHQINKEDFAQRMQPESKSDSY